MNERVDCVAGNRLGALGMAHNLELAGWRKRGPARQQGNVWIVAMERARY